MLSLMPRSFLPSTITFVSISLFLLFLSLLCLELRENRGHVILARLLYSQSLTFVDHEKVLNKCMLNE